MCKQFRISVIIYLSPARRSWIWGPVTKQSKSAFKPIIHITAHAKSFVQAFILQTLAALKPDALLLKLVAVLSPICQNPEIVAPPAPSLPKLDAHNRIGAECFCSRIECRRHEGKGVRS